MCKNHEYVKTYFCLEEGCQMPLCPDCYFDDHLGHPKKSLKAVYEERKREVEATMGTFDQKLSQFESLLTEMQEKVKNARKFETEQKGHIDPFIDFIKDAVYEECKRKVAEYEQWSAKNVQPDYEERKSFKAEIGVRPIVEFV